MSSLVRLRVLKSSNENRFSENLIVVFPLGPILSIQNEIGNRASFSSSTSNLFYFSFLGYGSWIVVKLLIWDLLSTYLTYFSSLLSTTSSNFSSIILIIILNLETEAYLSSSVSYT